MEAPVSSTPTPAARFLTLVEAAFKTACAASDGGTDRSFTLAGSRLRLRFAGDALVEPLTRAFRHLSAPTTAQSPSLEVACWDAASTGVPLPPPPWGVDAYGVRSEIVGYNDDEIHTCFQSDTGSLVLFDVRRRLAFYATVDARRLPAYESSAPLRSILHWWARLAGCQLVHAGAVAGTKGCALLVGEGGVGKSSTALACLPSPLRYLADDYCLLDPRSSPAVVHSIYSSAKVGRQNFDRMPFLSALASNPQELDREKAILFLAEHMPDKLLAQAPLRAILLPCVANRDSSRIEPASAVGALVTLASSSHLQLPNAGAELLRRLRPVVQNVPVFRLHLGRDAAEIAGTIHRFLEQLPVSSVAP